MMMTRWWVFHVTDFSASKRCPDKIFCKKTLRILFDLWKSYGGSDVMIKYCVRPEIFWFGFEHWGYPCIISRFWLSWRRKEWVGDKVIRKEQGNEMHFSSTINVTTSNKKISYIFGEKSLYSLRRWCFVLIIRNWMHQRRQTYLILLFFVRLSGMTPSCFRKMERLF